MLTKNMPKSCFVVPSIIFAIIVLAYNDVEAVDKRCHKVPVIRNFDVDKLTGTWYGQEVGDMDGNESSRTCLAYNVFSDKKKSNATTTEIKLFNGTTTFPYAEVYHSHQINDTSEFEVDWKNDGKKLNAWAIGTDFATWSTWYLCQPEQEDRGVLFIVTTAKYPNSTTLETARNSARKAGFKMTKPYLKRIDQSHCFN